MFRLLTLAFTVFAAIPLLAQETSVSSDVADSGATLEADETPDTAANPDEDTPGVETAEGDSGDAAEPEEEGLRILDAADVSLDDFLWTSRPILVFADTPADLRFQEQIDLLTDRPDELIARDVVVITDTDPGARSEVRLKFRPRGFQLTLVGKDGRVNLRKPFPWDVREISHAIDKWPLRQQELRGGG